MNAAQTPNAAPARIEDFLRSVQKGQENVLEVVEAMTGDGQKMAVLALQNRQLQPEPPDPPQRRESPRRAHAFHDVEGFAAYLAKYKTADTVVLADTAGLAIRAVLDERAKDGFEILVLSPAIHPLFRPWQALLEPDTDPLRIAEFAEFVMTNRRAVVAPDPRELVLMLSQVKASKKITIDRGRGMRSLNGVMIETVIQGQDKTEFVDLPDSLTIRVPLFVRTSPLQIEVDLLALAGDGDVFMRAVSADVDQAKVEAFEEMCQAVAAIEGVVVGTGSPNHCAWDYLK